MDWLKSNNTQKLQTQAQPSFLQRLWGSKTANTVTNNTKNVSAQQNVRPQMNNNGTVQLPQNNSAWNNNNGTLQNNTYTKNAPLQSNGTQQSKYAPRPWIPDNQTGGSSYVFYKSRKYLLREGSRGGKYILVQGSRKYL